MELNPVQLNFEEIGEGIPVVFLHGFPFDHTIWGEMVPLLRDQARVILPDLRGFGGSPVTDGVYSMRLLAEDILQLLNKEKIDRAILVGHSMGGYISLAFAHAYPHRLAGLALVSTQAAADTPERRQSRLQLVEEIGRRGTKVVAEGMTPKLCANPDLGKPLHKMMMKWQAKALVGALKGMAERPDALEWLPAISIPTVVIAGTADAFIPIERAETMAQLLGMGWLVSLPGIGHMPMLEAPRQTAEALSQLIQRVEN
jgi:3-oxoadipate enol-lactonase